MISQSKFGLAVAGILLCTSMASAQITRSRSRIGPRGGTRSLSQTRGDGQFSGTRQATGTNGATYTINGMYPRYSTPTTGR